MKLTTRDAPTKPVHSKSGRSSLEFCSHTPSLALTQRGGNRGFIYIFWVPAKPWSFIAAPADSITANGNIVGLVPSY